MKRYKDKKIALRLSKDLHLKIEKIAAEKEESISLVTRRLIVMGLEKKKTYIDLDPIIYELHNFSTVMSRIGGNLNQLSHYFNMNRTVNESELELVHEALRNQFKEIASYIHTIKNKLIDERNIGR